MEQRGADDATVPGALSAALASGFGVLRLAIAGGAGGPGPVGSRIWNLRLLLLPLLVPWAPDSGTPRKRNLEKWTARIPLLPVLGEGELDAAVGWAEQRYVAGARIQY